MDPPTHSPVPLSPPSSTPSSPYEVEDEIVWSLSGTNISFSAHDSDSGDNDSDSGDNDSDFVLLDKPRSVRAIDSDLSDSQDETRTSASTNPPFVDAPAVPSVTSSLTRDDDSIPKVIHSAKLEPSTATDRAATPTPIPVPQAPERGDAHSEIAKVATPPPAVETPVSAPVQETVDNREEAGAAIPLTAVATPEDKEEAKKERRRAARKRRRQQKKLRGKQSDSASKATPNKVVTETTPAELYQEASSFISSFLESPVAKRDSVYRLTLFQSLIVEFGLVSKALPTSLRAAQTFIKSHVFVNIKEYLANRGCEQAEIQRLLYPSRSALIKDIRRKRNTASLKYVKQHGLNVLLVGCFNHSKKH
ncbi:hypothetical protein AX15_004944 [Amanita polypyramis BW_CC]|nr:hypothetical protein AX15_004944 [Amanita polypyramis BW_CC]